jgi:hypothetical protein
MNVKTRDQVQAQLVASRFTEYLFKDLVDKVETIIDEGKSDRHDQICRKAESIIEN